MFRISLFTFARFAPASERFDGFCSFLNFPCPPCHPLWTPAVFEKFAPVFPVFWSRSPSFVLFMACFAFQCFVILLLTTLLHLEFLLPFEKSPCCKPILPLSNGSLRLLEVSSPLSTGFVPFLPHSSCQTLGLSGSLLLCSNTSSLSCCLV